MNDTKQEVVARLKRCQDIREQLDKAACDFHRWHSVPSHVQDPSMDCVTFIEVAICAEEFRPRITREAVVHLGTGCLRVSSLTFYSSVEEFIEEVTQ
jgi:hypothetical protein